MTLRQPLGRVPRRVWVLVAVLAVVLVALGVAALAW